MILFHDFESRSKADITKVGTYRYAQDPSTRALMCAYSFGLDEPVEQWIPAEGQKMPSDLKNAIRDPDVVKRSWNASMEKAIWYYVLGEDVVEEEWRCTMVQAMTLSMPGKLEKAGPVVDLPVDKQKDSRGKRLINLFCKEHTPTKKHPYVWYNRWTHPEEWEEFKEYNVQDVVTEKAIYKRIKKWDLPEDEWAMYHLDQEINRDGVPFNMRVIERAIEFVEYIKAKRYEEMRRITGIENPRSTVVLLKWLKKHGYRFDDLKKGHVQRAAADEELDEEVRDVLRMRVEVAKTSTDKYYAIKRAQVDGVVQGAFQFCGAQRTWRWCLTGDHEVLTPAGWKSLDGWFGGEIACWTPNGGRISFQKSEQLVFPYEGPLVIHETARMSQAATPDHQMPCYHPKTGRFEKRKVTEIASWDLPFTGELDAAAGYNSDQLRVLVMVQADGHFAKSGELRLKFKKLRKVERAQRLFRRAGIIFSTGENADGSTIVSVARRNLPIYLAMFSEKTFGSWLLGADASVFFDELEHWDAYRAGPNSLQYSTTNKTNADWVQILAHTSGRSANMSSPADRNEKWNQTYNVSIWLTPSNRHRLRKSQQFEHHTGEVYCAATPTGFFLVRRGGKVWITGNSGRIFQPQNMARPHKAFEECQPDLVDHIAKLTNRQLELLYDAGDKYDAKQAGVMDMLSSATRPAIQAPEGEMVFSADASAIENRVLGYMAEDQKILNVFRKGRDPYVDFSSYLWGTTYKIEWERYKPEDGSKGNKDHRNIAKPGTLGCGYMLSAGEEHENLKTGEIEASGLLGYAWQMGILEFTLEDSEHSVKTWRGTFTDAVQYWWEIQKAAKRCIRTKKRTEAGPVEFIYDSPFLKMRLPSGRCLYYVRPRIETKEQFWCEKKRKFLPWHLCKQPNRDKKKLKENITYEGQDDMKRWVRINTHPGKLTENGDQGIARDVLKVGMQRFRARVPRREGRIRLHVHDEIVGFGPRKYAQRNYDILVECLSEEMPWASEKELPLGASGSITACWIKD